jgi:hypothetical protein
MTQNERLLVHLNTGASITPMEAWRELGIYRLGARVFDLRKQGNKVEKKTAVVMNRFGEECHVAKYRLCAPDD